MSLKCLLGHKWNGCKCGRCGKIRNEQHDWDGCKCKQCGKTRDEQHDQNGCMCKRCGKIMHDWKEIDIRRTCIYVSQDCSAYGYEDVFEKITTYRCQICGIEHEERKEYLYGTD